MQPSPFQPSHTPSSSPGIHILPELRPVGQSSGLMTKSFRPSLNTLSDDTSSVLPTTPKSDATKDFTILVAYSRPPTCTPSPLGPYPQLSSDEMSKREDSGATVKINTSWSSLSICLLVTAGGTVFVFVSLAVLGGGDTPNDDRSTGTPCITLCSSTDDEMAYQCSDPFSLLPFCSQNPPDEVVVETEYDENNSCGVISALRRAPAVFEAGVHLSRAQTVLDIVDLENAEDEAFTTIVSSQPATFTGTLAPVPEETSICFERDETSEFSI